MNKENNENKIDLPDKISKQEVYDVLSFASSLYGTQALTPNLVNTAMKNVNMNPAVATKGKIDKALQNPQYSEEQLVGYSEFFEYTDMTYKRLLSYLGNMLSFDYTFEPINATDKQMATSQYKTDENRYYEFMDKFNVKQEFVKVMHELVRKETFFSSLRTDGDKYVLQDLPAKYCKITGESEYGLLFDFNMDWFLNSGTDIDMYDPVFKEYMRRIKKDNNNSYNPANPINNRTSSWVNWVQTDPEDGMWAWKFNMSQAGVVPHLSAMFPDLVNAPYIRELQTNKFIIEASRVMIGLIPLLKENKGGSFKDMLALDPETAGRFGSLIKQGLPNPISFGVAPFDEVKTYDFHTTDYNMYNDYVKTKAGVSGTNSTMLFGAEKMNAEETRNSISIDEFIMTHIYPYFANFIDFYINKITKKYKFKTTFEGTNLYTSRKNRLDQAMTLADKGFLMPQKIAASVGMNYNQMKRQLIMARNDNITDILIHVADSYNMSAQDQANSNNKGGAPVNEEPDDNTVASRENASNIDKGGNT